MKHQKLTPFDLFLDGVALIVFCLAGVAAWNSSWYWACLVCAAFIVLIGWSIIEGIRNGLRAQTTSEQLENRLFLRAIAIFVGGGAFLAITHTWLMEMPLLGLLVLAIWLGASLYAASRLRGRHESLEAYLQRVSRSKKNP